MITGHSSHWGLSPLQDLLEEQHGRAQAIREISAMHWEGFLMWMWDGLITGDAGEIQTGWVDYRVGGNLNLLFGILLSVVNRHGTSTTERTTFLQSRLRSNDV